MFFFYSRKLQIIMFMLWCAGMAAMYTAVTGGDADFFQGDKNPAPVENAAARVGTMPAPPAPPSPPAAPAPPAPPPPPADDNYVIREGDTVIKIAARHGLDPKSIIERNRLTDPDLLRPGDTLILPAPGDAQATDKSRHAPHGLPTHNARGQNAYGARHGTSP
ncbi:MAG: LysM peptidoglycan-binding domain-containing protein [Desulfovibrio sp.]|jgi:hypothetical protein|nr:LysM peptidoglycan-binding domain-containing protein [Desulfovibrio sp.]